MKTAEETAKELITKFKPFVNSLTYSPMAELSDGPYSDDREELDNAKKCALVVVDYMMNEGYEYDRNFWKEVGAAIKSLTKM